MMIEQFIDRLEQQGLLDPQVIGELRRKVARVKGKKMTPEAIAKYLVDKGHLTRFQATKLVNDVTALLDSGAADASSKERGSQAKTQSGDDFTLLPSDHEFTTSGETRPASEGTPGKKTPKPVDEELEELTAIDDGLTDARKAAEQRAAERKAIEQRAAERRAADRETMPRRWSDSDEPVKPASGAMKRQQTPSTRQPQPPPAAPTPSPPPVVVPGESVLDELAADIEANSALATAGRRSVGMGGLFGGGGRSPVQRKLQKSSEWDSMLLLVGGASLGVLLIVGGFLYFSLTRGAAEDLFAAAEQAYRDESYALSIKLYDKYLEDASQAREGELCPGQT